MIFEAKEQNGLIRVEYMRKHPKVSKFMYEAFYATPEELKPDINKFKAYINNKHGSEKEDKDNKMKQMFDQLPIREGVDKEQAYELINIVSEHFRKQLATDLADESKLSDDQYWKSFFDKKNDFLNIGTVWN